MTKHGDMTPAARFFHDLAAEGYGWRRTAVIDAYKDAVAAGKTQRYRCIGDANEMNPMRVYLVALLAKTKVFGGKHFPLDTDELLSYLPWRDADDGEINWDGFDDWLDHDGGWATFRDICLDWEPQWFLDFLEREGYTEKGV